VLPLKDNVPTRSFPAVSVAVIAVNVAIYLYEFFLWFDPPAGGHPSLGGQLYEQFVVEFGLVPCRFREICPPRLDTVLTGAPPPTLTIFTSMFVHGGLLHVGGNMLYLWIFGRNVEDSMGHGRFLVFYLVCGLAAAAAQYLLDPASAIPMVGASGAVSGTLGAYLLLHPRARIWTLVIFGFFVRVVPVPAMIVLGFWVVLQFVNSVFTFVWGDTGGVAFLAHLGGFIAGLMLLGVFRRPRIQRRRRRGL
jgi:membrane associated rhomboid family serine protease